MAIPIAMADGLREEREVAIIGVRDFGFEPFELRIRSSQWVRWVNLDDVPFRVVHAAHPHMFRSAVLFPGEAFNHQFREPGDFPYRCDIHPRMRGIVIVS